MNAVDASLPVKRDIDFTEKKFQMCQQKKRKYPPDNVSNKIRKTSIIERYLGEPFQNNEPSSAMEKSVPESFSEAENFSQYEDCERKSVEEPLESRECEMMITAPTTHEADKDYRCSVINLPTQTEYNVFMNWKRKNSSSSSPRRESSSTDNTTQFRFMKKLRVELNPLYSKEHESQPNSFNCKKQRNVCSLKTSSNTFPRDISNYDPGDISTLDSGDISSSIARDISNSISEVESSSSKEHRNQKKQRNVCFPKVSSSYIPEDIPCPALGDILSNIPEDIPSSGSRNISSNVPEDIKSSDSRDILNSIAGDISSSISEVESSSSKEHRNQAKSYIKQWNVCSYNVRENENMMESSANGTTELHSNLRYENSCNAIESENIVDCKQENNLIPTHSLIQEETNCSNLYTGTESIESSDFENLKDPVMADSFSQNQSQPDSSASSSRARSSENCIERTQIENDSNPNVEIINTTTPEKTDASYEKDYNLKKLSVKLTRAKVHSVSYGWTFLKQLASDVYNDFYKQNKRIDLKKIYKLNIVSPYTSLTRTVFQHRLSYLLNKLIRENIKKEREEKRLCIRGKIVRLNSKLDSATRLSLHSSYSEVHLTRDRKIERKFRKTKTNKKTKLLGVERPFKLLLQKAPRRLVQPRRHSVVNQPSCSFSRPDRMPSRQEPKELKVCDPKVTHRPILHIPQPEQPSPIPSTSFHIPQPEQLNSSPQPSTDFQISLPEQLSSSPQPPTSFQIPQPEQPSSSPKPEQPSSSPKPEQPSSSPKPEQPSSSPKPEQLSSSPNPFIDFQISQLEQLSSSPQPNTNFQIPQPEQLSSSPNPSIDFGISQPEQLSSSPIPSTSYQIRQLEQLGSSPQPPTNFQNYSMDHLSLSGLNHLPINAKSSAANKSFYLGNDKTEMDNDSDNTELFQLSQKPLFAITSLC